MRNISILHKIIISILVTISLFSACTYFFIYSYYDDVVALRKTELKRKVDLAVSIIQGHRDNAKKNGLTVEQAEKNAYEQIEALRFGKEGYFYIFEGMVLKYNGVSPYLKNTSLMGYLDENGNDIFYSKAKIIWEKGEAYFYWPWQREDSYDNILKLSYNRMIPGTDLWIGTGVFVDDLQAIFWQGSAEAISITVVLTIVLIFYSLAISRSVTHPLFKVRTRMVQLANGDVTSPVPEVDAGDEVGEMARAVETFRENKKYARELELINSEIEKQAHHDPLTGLANRRHFDILFNRLKESCLRSGDSIFLFHLDLDHFKQTNDTLGHAAGDHVLRHTAEVLNELTSEGDAIARIGGDEFLIVGPTDGNTQSLRRLAEEIIQALALPIPYENSHCRIGGSIGIAIDYPDAVVLSSLVNRADMALYRAKDKGRNRFEVFSKDMELEVLDKNKNIEEFLVGLDLGQLVPYYQPQFDLKTLDVTGVEVLARWRHPERGVLSPGAFLSIAEDQKVMGRINQAIAIQSLRDCIRLKAEGLTIPKLSVNFSLDSLKDPDLISWLDNLRPFPTKFSMELIETISFEDCDQIVKENIEKIKERDIDIEIDDFGSSNASILGLLEVGPHRLKIDRKLVAPIVKSKFYRKILSSISEIAIALNVEVIAEGVETMEHLEQLKKFDIQSFQGFALAEPMPYEDLKLFLTEEKWQDAEPIGEAHG